MKRKLLIFTCVLLISMLASCQNTADAYDQALLLHLSFDEGSGHMVSDESGHQEDKVVQYVFNNAEFMDENQDPQWRDTGVNQGSLLFDGYSNYIRYDADDITLDQEQLTISTWIAPRYFESSNGNYTAIVSQYNSDFNQGVLLGYFDYGQLIFQVGIGDRNYTLISSEQTLVTYEWQYLVAVFNGTDGHMALYLNGEEVVSQTIFDGISIEKALDEPLYIAKNSEGGSNATASLNMVSGLLDELKIYDTAVTADDVKQQYESTHIPEIEFEDIWLQNILTTDYYKTQYHGGPYQHWMNEPHAPIYYQGVYHLFFQFNMFGPYFANISWGHLVSDDLVNWRPLKEVITIDRDSVAANGVWSGAATYDADGTPVLFFTAGDYDYQSKGLISSQNIGIARPKDLSDPYLTEWVVDDELAIAQGVGEGTPGEFRDPSIFYEDGVWYMTVCSSSTISNGGTALLYTSTGDFHNWTYQGQLYEIQNQRSDLGYTWELPVLLPVYNAERTVKKYILLISPAPADRADNDIYYFLGDFDKDSGRFIPDEAFVDNPHLLDYGNNVFTGPSGFVDPVSQKTYVMSIMQDQRKPSDVALSGWANSVGLAREVYLLDDGSDVGIRAVEAVEDYETVLYEGENLTLEAANEAIENIQGDMLHIQVAYQNIDSSMFGIDVRKNNDILEKTIIYYDVDSESVGLKTGLSATTNNYQNITGNFYGNLTLVDGELVLDIYLDRSLVEIFANQYKAISGRIYPDQNSLNIALFAESGTVLISYIKVSEVQSIYE